MSFSARRRPAADAGDDARQLDALVRESAAAGIARQALLLRLSLLPRDLAQPHHLRLAQEALEPLHGADRARVFVLPNHDTVVVWRGAAPALLAASRARLRHLFAGEAAAVPDLDLLVQHLALPDDALTLRAAVAASQRPPARPAAAATPTAPLDPEALARLEAALTQADLTRFARRRPVCARAGDGFRLAWETRVFSIAELAETLMPDRALKAEPWLFRRLTRTLDRRMMALLAAPQELRDAGPFALVLNVASILSPAFLRFDAAVPARLRGQVVLELRPADLLADPASFRFARDFARARGYRLLLGGLTAALLDVFPPAAVGCDFVQVAWSPDLAAAAVGARAGALVLGGVEDGAALGWGMAQGIALFQGGLARPASRVAA